MIQFQAQTEPIAALSFSLDGKRLLAGGGWQTNFAAKLWDLSAKAVIQQFIGHSDSITGVHFSAGEKKVVTTSLDGSIRVWDLKTGKSHNQIKVAGEILSSQLLADGKTVLASCRPVQGNQSGTCLLIDLETAKPLGRMLGGESDFGFGMVASPNGKFLLAGDSDSYSFHVWELF